MFIPSYKKPGGGGTTIPTWADGTDEEIIAALEAHYNDEIDLTQYWSVGDERIVHLSAMSATGVGESHVEQDVIFVLSEIGGKTLATSINGHTECIFQVDQKDALLEKGYINSNQSTYGGWKNSKRRAWCNSTYKDAFPSNYQYIFKQFKNSTGQGSGLTSTEVTTDTFALRSEIEVFNSTNYSVAGEGSQIELYKTTTNRIKYVNDSKTHWWCRSPYASQYFVTCTTSGIVNAVVSNVTSVGIAPFGVV